jgi:hypothetical protein
MTEIGRHAPWRSLSRKCLVDDAAGVRSPSPRQERPVSESCTEKGKSSRGDGMRREYKRSDFPKGFVRGKYAPRFAATSTVATTKSVAPTYVWKNGAAGTERQSSHHARGARISMRGNQNACETPAKYPRRAPNCGAPTPIPVPSRISYFLSRALMTSKRTVSPVRPCRSKSWLAPRLICV